MDKIAIRDIINEYKNKYNSERDINDIIKASIYKGYYRAIKGKKNIQIPMKYTDIVEISEEYFKYKIEEARVGKKQALSKICNKVVDDSKIKVLINTEDFTINRKAIIDVIESQSIDINKEELENTIIEIEESIK